MPQHELILHGGKIITLDGASRVAQALGVRDGRIAAVGDAAMVMKDKGPGTKVLDVAGKTVTPGFFDAHPHMDRHGLKHRGGIPLDGCRSIKDILQVIKEAASRTPRGEWIVLMPMGSPPHEYVSRPEQLAEGRFPDRHDLDRVAPDHPVYVRAVWGWWSRRPFPSVANSRALARAGVTRHTTPPPGVEILRDAAGEPTGVFLERNFVPVLEYTLFRALPRFTQACRLAMLTRPSPSQSPTQTAAAWPAPHSATAAASSAARRSGSRERIHVVIRMSSFVPFTEP